MNVHTAAAISTLVILFFSSVDAFGVVSPVVTSHRKTSFVDLRESASDASELESTMMESQPTSRRKLLFRGIGCVAATMATSASPAFASYSAYAAREKDWEQRGDSGEIHFSTAKDLRKQLREIAPMNAESANLFCPNGASSAVSPLMENRCGDREATPSVFGRAEDIAGNSIPGLVAGRKLAPGDSSNQLASNPIVGGFPKY